MRSIDPALVDHAVELYLSGKSTHQVAADLGIGATTLSRKLKARGIEPRSNRRDLPVAEVVEKYRAGVSEYALATEYSVERAVIAKRLEEAGVERRDCGEAATFRYASTTREQRKALTAAANAAKRGVAEPEERLIRSALTREGEPKPMSTHEARFADWLSERNVPHTREKAIGRYNTDFAVGPVAVEILGGEWHNTRTKFLVHGRRTPYILDQGWAIAFLWATPTHPMTDAVADYIVAYVDEVSRNPALRGEYRVVRGDAQLLARGRKEDYERTGIVPARYS